MDNFVIKATDKFLKDAKKLLSDQDLEELYDLLSINPTIGVLYHYSNNILIILLGVFSKSVMENISAAERKQLKKLVPQLIELFKEEL